MTRLRIRPLFKWFDMWVGIFVDTKQRRVYILPMPCIGVVIEWSKS